jgi:hypothetical protein
VLPFWRRVRQLAAGTFEQQRKDTNEYVETESAWKQYARNSRTGTSDDAGSGL